MSQAARDRVDVPTPFGIVPLWGRALASNRTAPAVVIINGAFYFPGILTAALPAVMEPFCDVFISHFPGLHAPSLKNASVETFAAAIDAAIEQALSGRSVVLLGYGAGAVVALAARSPAIQRIIALEPMLETAELWPILPAIRRVHKKYPEQRPLIAALYGLTADGRFTKSHYNVLTGLNIPTEIFHGDAPLGKPRDVSEFPSLVSDAARERLAAAPGVTIHTLPKTGHSFDYRAQLYVRQALIRAVRAGNPGDAGVPALLEPRQYGPVVPNQTPAPPDRKAWVYTGPKSREAPRVTVGIPAYKPEHLRQAIESVLAQTYPDFELLISDDSRDGSVRRIVDQFKDQRIRMIDGPRQGLVSNSAHIWNHASNDFLKFLYDDDYLYADCLSKCISYIGVKKLSYLFSNRNFVDKNNKLISSPSSIVGNLPVILQNDYVSSICADRMLNIFGEPSNLLIRMSAFDGPECMTQYKGIGIRHLTDVAFYMNAADRGQCIGLPQRLSAFRQHAGQVSSRRSAPGFSAGIFEWEIFMRGALDDGIASPDAVTAKLGMLAHVYEQYKSKFQELNAFEIHIPLLLEQIRIGERPLLSEEFRARIAQAHQMIDLRAADQANAAPP